MTETVVVMVVEVIGIMFFGILISTIRHGLRRARGMRLLRTQPRASLSCRVPKHGICTPLTSPYLPSPCTQRAVE